MPVRQWMHIQLCGLRAWSYRNHTHGGGLSLQGIDPPVYISVFPEHRRLPWYMGQDFSPVTDRPPPCGLMVGRSTIVRSNGVLHAKR